MHKMTSATGCIFGHIYMGVRSLIRFPSFISVMAAVGPPTYSMRGVGETYVVRVGHV